MWYIGNYQGGPNAIYRMNAQGTVTNMFAIPSAGSQPAQLVNGPDGSLWFTESAAGKIGRLQ